MSIATAIAPARRRKVAKSTSREVETKMKLGVSLSSDAYKRIGVASILYGKSQGEIIEELIQQHLGGVVFYQKTDRSPQESVSDDPTLKL